MKEILFRAKDFVTGDWRYGFYLEMTQDSSPCIKAPDSVGSHYRHWGVTRETVGQYIGLRDSDRRKIFEGDVVEYYIERNKTIATILYSVRRTAFQLHTIGTPTQLLIGLNVPISLGLCDPDLNIKIIGNIHDNPELLA